MDTSQKFLSPQTLAKIKNLELKARTIIEGLVSGAHKSPLQGVSVEFAEHREYVPGDDIRHVDWKVYGKTDKFYLKRYEQETNLVCNLVVDCSESMKYASAEVTKFRYASGLAAALAYLILHQQDSVGLTLFDDKIEHLVQPAGQPSHLKQVMHLLATQVPSRQRGSVGTVLDELAGRLRKRSLVVVFSDFFDDVAALTKGIKHLRYRRHEVVAFQVLDPAELDFPFDELTLFKGLEGMPEQLADPKGIRGAYREQFGGFLKELQLLCRGANVDYRQVRTDEPEDVVLATYLASRLARSA